MKKGIFSLIIATIALTNGSLWPSVPAQPAATLPRPSSTAYEPITSITQLSADQLTILNDIALKFFAKNLTDILKRHKPVPLIANYINEYNPDFLNIHPALEYHIKGLWHLNGKEIYASITSNNPALFSQIIIEEPNIRSDVGINNSGTILHEAVMDQNLNALNILLTIPGIDPNSLYRNKERSTPLIMAVRLNNLPIVHALLKAGADQFKPVSPVGEWKKQTYPLIAAVKEGNSIIVERLLQDSSLQNAIEGRMRVFKLIELEANKGNIAQANELFSKSLNEKSSSVNFIVDTAYELAQKLHNELAAEDPKRSEYAKIITLLAVPYKQQRESAIASALDQDLLKDLTNIVNEYETEVTLPAEQACPTKKDKQVP